MSDLYGAGNASLFVTAARELPRSVLAVLLSSFDGKTYEVISIQYGERGYYKTSHGRQTRAWVAEQNAALGIDPATAAAYSMCSVFGNWSNYDAVLQDLQTALSNAEETQCTCCDPVHPGDDKNCPIHGGE